MDVLGIDIAKAKFDASLQTGQANWHASFSNTEAGFAQLFDWMQRHRPDPAQPLHACMEATGNWGLDVATFLHEAGLRVSIVNPARIKAFGEAELSRNKTDKLDAALIGRFCRALNPMAWQPPAPHLRELREMVRRCDALKVARVQELNRRKAGVASEGVAASIEAHIAFLDSQIVAISQTIDALIASDPAQKQSRDLLLSIPGVGPVCSAVIMAELPNIVDFTPKALAAFAGLSPSEHSSGQSRQGAHIARIGSARLRAVLYLAALSARRYNTNLAAFVQRMKDAGKPPKVTLIAIARRLLVYAHAVLRTHTPFNPNFAS